MSGIHVVKRDGTREPFDANKINLALVKATEGLPDQISKVVQVATELQTGQEIRNVLSNSFGFGGNCSSLIFSKC